MGRNLDRGLEDRNETDRYNDSGFNKSDVREIVQLLSGA